MSIGGRDRPSPPIVQSETLTTEKIHPWYRPSRAGSGSDQRWRGQGEDRAVDGEPKTNPHAQQHTRGPSTALVILSANTPVAAFVGIVTGVPLGIALGRRPRDPFVRDIFAVPMPTAPVVPVVMIVVSDSIVAN
jgi:hypothetical protein